MADTSRPAGLPERQVARDSDPQAGHQIQGLLLGGKRHERQAQGRRRRDDRQRRFDDDPERSLGTDEEVDEVHSRGREVPGRQLRNVGHAVARDGHPHEPVGQLDLEVPGGVCPNLPSFDVEDIPRRQDDREARDPVACAPVLERRGARSVRRNRAANEGAVVRRGGRVVTSRRRQLPLQVHQRHAGLQPHVPRPALERRRHARGREHDLAPGRGAAGDRRLGPNRQDPLVRAEHRRHFGLRAREDDPCRAAAGVVRGILQVGPDSVRVGDDRRGGDRAPGGPGGDSVRHEEYPNGEWRIEN